MCEYVFVSVYMCVCVDGSILFIYFHYLGETYNHVLYDIGYHACFISLEL